MPSAYFKQDLKKRSVYLKFYDKKFERKKHFTFIFIGAGVGGYKIKAVLPISYLDLIAAKYMFANCNLNSCQNINTEETNCIENVADIRRKQVFPVN